MKTIYYLDFISEATKKLELWTQKINKMTFNMDNALFGTIFLIALGILGFSLISFFNKKK